MKNSCVYLIYVIEHPDTFLHDENVPFCLTGILMRWDPISTSKG